MKPFNLEEALTGKYCVTRNGDKAMVVFDKSVLSSEAVFPLVGYIFRNNRWVTYESTWKKDGTCASSGKDNVDDIVGMWEESQPEVNITIPAPVVGIQSGIEYWTFDSTTDDMEIYSLKEYHPDFYKTRLEYGQVFKTKEDAQSFLEAMKEARR